MTLRNGKGLRRRCGTISVRLIGGSATNDYKAAEVESRELLAIYREKWGPIDVRTARATMARATALIGLRRWEEGITLAEELYAQQRRAVGDEAEITRRSTTALAELCSNAAWSLASPTNSRRENYELALKWSNRSVALNTARTWQWTWLGLAHYRLGDYQLALDALKIAAQRDYRYSERAWWLLSMVYAKLDDQQAARDCCTVAHYRNSDDNAFRNIRAEARELVFAHDSPNELDLSASGTVDACSRLIELHPRGYFLYQCLSGCSASLDHWGDAAKYLGKVIELHSDPYFLLYEVWVAYLLQAEEIQKAREVCRSVFEKSRNRKLSPHEQLRLVMLCCLASPDGIDFQELDKIAVDAQSEGAPETAVSVARRMVAYRRQQFLDAAGAPLEYAPENDLSAETALAATVNRPISQWQEHELSLAFKALAHQAQGEVGEAQRLVTEARRRAPRKLSATLQARLVNRYPQAMWCLVQAAVREVESQIGPASPGAASANAPDLGDRTR